MPTGAPSAQKIIDAWFSVGEEWIVRRNKTHDDGRQWEVVRRWGDLSIVDDATQSVVERFDNKFAAHAKAADLERLARAGAVQSMIAEWNK